MKILCVLGEHNYGDSSRGGCYEYVNFLPALRQIGHEILFFESYNRGVHRDFAELNRRLLEKVQIERPDVVLFVLMHYEIWLETLELIRAGSGAILMNWSTDDSWKYEQFSRFLAPQFHIYATTYPSAIAKATAGGHSNFVLTQWATNSSNPTPPMPGKECRYPVSFIGSAYGNRPRWIESLKRRGIDVTCFGYGWDNGTILSESIPFIIRNSCISLNFVESGIGINGFGFRRSRQVKARTFEVPGAGGFLLTGYTEGLEAFYQIEKEIEVFHNIGDLVEKIRHYTAHLEERDRIAMAGYFRTMNEHTYAIRFKELLGAAELLMRDRKNRCMPKNTEIAYLAIDFQKFTEIGKQHKVGVFLNALKWLLTCVCIILLGHKRGPRAARRLFFEISWRAVGRKTYAASGWPGRLFYRES
jgi:spore maturation protein CgeB